MKNALLIATIIAGLTPAMAGTTDAAKKPVAPTTTEQSAEQTPAEEEVSGEEAPAKN